ncbi:NAD(P)/FAD-dependent oxidoreductase [Parvularcula dongshanensis]|uniref:Amine oxidase domain-containing protein n=1 Tax=Parvularcula dongshanensis TaxID=1173995 RepID=A0A840I4M3_9PROT|nr:FAD-dependent oxidoreductase [Parvularcula dongshanensis]MBB4659799.1 hypothetical protein [Parvularcula dongshanensis]
MIRSRVAIIGAGVAGLACGRVLSDAGVDVALYDKGRGPGGRCSTRRTPFGSFDHGAQFFTVRDEGFERAVSAWRDAGHVSRWDGRFVRIKNGNESPYDGDHRFVGTPRMNAFVKAEAEALGAHFGLRIATPRGREDRWQLYSEHGQSAWEAEWLVFATPAEQTAALLAGTGRPTSLLGGARRARSSPTWTLMAAFEGEEPVPFDAASLSGHDIAFASFEPSKPGRGGAHRWVVHASTDWSRAHLEEAPEDIVPKLTDMLCDLIEARSRPVHAVAHRWRYAQVDETAPESFALDADARLATCGDWHVAPRVESAWVSGHRLGAALIDELR